MCELQVLSWITSYAWYLLYIVPVYLSWTWGTWAWDKYSMFKAMAGGGAAPGTGTDSRCHV